MIYLYDPYYMKYIAEDTIARYLHEAETDHLAKESKPRQPRHLPNWLLKGLRHLRYSLATIGRRSERIETNPI